MLYRIAPKSCQGGLEPIASTLITRGTRYALSHTNLGQKRTVGRRPTGPMARDLLPTSSPSADAAGLKQRIFPKVAPASSIHKLFGSQLTAHVLAVGS